MNYYKGFIAPLLLALIALLLIGGWAYVYTQQKQANPPVSGNVTLPQATSTAPTKNQTTSATHTSNARVPVPTINSIATSTDDHYEAIIVISGNNFINNSSVEYLSNGKHIDAFCAQITNGKPVHSWSQPEGGWSYYLNVNQLKIINNDCKTDNVKTDNNYPTSATMNIKMVGNFPVLITTP